ncbi:MAG: TetR/AcrR family transcriptional regulator [Kineosporiaceae bacterium]|nr:TetR/AcrR family transcriptional regulator [Aeromicrobium sp.]
MATSRRTSTKATKARGGKDVILTAATKNFQAFGYHGTSMRDIARDADVTVAAIYHHFASKQEILQDIMVRSLSDVISLTRTALLGSGSSSSDQLHALMTAWILFHTSRQPEAIIGASEIRSLDPSGRRLITTLRDEQERMFRDVIDRGIAEGDFATPYSHDAARAIIEMGYAVAAWYRQGGHLHPQEMAQRYAELALATVRAAPR